MDLRCVMGVRSGEAIASAGDDANAIGGLAFDTVCHGDWTVGTVDTFEVLDELLSSSSV